MAVQDVSTITWLHISDLHLRVEDPHSWHEDIVLGSLLGDVQQCIGEYGLSLDFAVVSGDISFSGAAAEFTHAMLAQTALP